jgi:hypothetical protein
MIWYYAKGKPKDRLEASDSAEIVARLQAARRRVAALNVPRSKGDEPEES